MNDINIIRMNDFNILENLKKNKKQNNILGGLDIGLSPKKGKTKNLLDIGVGFDPTKEKSEYERVPVANSTRKRVLIRQKGKCAWPNCKIYFYKDGITPHFDHIKRVDKGGRSSADNIQALCPNHHQSKTDKENSEKIEKTRKKAKKKDDGSLFGKNIFQL